MKKDGITANAILFFIRFISEFDRISAVKTTTKKLAKIYGLSDKSMQRYIKVLSIKNYIVDKRRVTPNNKNPEHKHVSHEIELTAKTYNILSNHLSENLNPNAVMELD
jgi:uncharacterized membrane protein (UPF0182 family)